jgi:polyhydroxybutyrate depolymerase
MGFFSSIWDMVWSPKPVVSAAPVMPATSYNPARNKEHLITMPSGLLRKIYVHVPPSYLQPANLSRTYPVVLAYHGGGGTVPAFKIQSQLDVTADDEDVIIVWMEGTDSLTDKYYTWNAKFCCGSASATKVDDVGYTKEAIRLVTGMYRVDHKRIYATGFSNGGSLCHILACEIPHLLAAVAPVSGGVPLDLLDFPDVSVPIYHIHGTLDRNATYGGGIGSNALSKVVQPNIPGLMSAWAKHNACGMSVVQNGQHGTTATWNPTSKIGAKTLLSSLTDGGHEWPGGVSVTPNAGTGPVSKFKANEAILAFFASHPKR